MIFWKSGRVGGKERQSYETGFFNIIMGDIYIIFIILHRLDL